ncbi:hypothetical protein FJTKL_04316 [Diaporthe vaccinii]|uniref:Uncharacterized protein n=1 Tax=Diaporthe vaccinii TaxID=105482 RepID=A0ABR4F0N0_9PEZI
MEKSCTFQTLVIPFLQSSACPGLFCALSQLPQPLQLLLVVMAMTSRSAGLRSVASRSSPALSSRLAGTPLPRRTFATSAPRASVLAAFKVPKIANEPNHHYAKGSSQREGLLSTVQKVKSNGTVNVPIVVGGKEVSTSSTLVSPPPRFDLASSHVYPHRSQQHPLASN